MLILTNERSGKPLGNQDFADATAVRFQDTAAPRDAAHQTTEYRGRTRAGHGRVIEVARLDQLTDALRGLDPKLTLACASRGLGVGGHKPRQMNGPSIRDDRIAFNDPNLLWADEGRRRVLRRYQDESENRQEPVHGNALRKTPFTVIIIDRCDKSQLPRHDFIEVWPRCVALGGAFASTLASNRSARQ
jgi:hypothetical protein